MGRTTHNKLRIFTYKKPLPFFTGLLGIYRTLFFVKHFQRIGAGVMILIIISNI